MSPSAMGEQTFLMLTLFLASGHVDPLTCNTNVVIAIYGLNDLNNPINILKRRK